MTGSQCHALVLGLLTLAFSLRFAGQLLVAFLGVGFLPPMEAWSSGAVPYAALLIVQVGILTAQVAIVCQLWSGSGPMTVTRHQLGRWLAWFSAVYFGVMVARFIGARLAPAEVGPFADMIPIVFHWVLASFCWVLSRQMRGRPCFGNGMQGRRVT